MTITKGKRIIEIESLNKQAKENGITLDKSDLPKNTPKTNWDHFKYYAAYAFANGAGGATMVWMVTYFLAMAGIIAVGVTEPALLPIIIGALTLGALGVLAAHAAKADEFDNDPTTLKGDVAAYNIYALYAKSELRHKDVEPDVEYGQDQEMASTHTPAVSTVGEDEKASLLDGKEKTL